MFMSIETVSARAEYPGHFDVRTPLLVVRTSPFRSCWVCENCWICSFEKVAI
jgi:hypothetical protein